MCSPRCFRESTLRTKSGIEVELQLDVIWVDTFPDFPDLDYNVSLSASLELL